MQTMQPPQSQFWLFSTRTTEKVPTKLKLAAVLSTKTMPKLSLLPVLVPKPKTRPKLGQPLHHFTLSLRSVKPCAWLLTAFSPSAVVNSSCYCLLQFGAVMNSLKRFYQSGRRYIFRSRKAYYFVCQLTLWHWVYQ